jgi:thiosulfate dehydrogenase [quinone] large subunit
MSKSGVYVLTAVSAVVFVLLCWIFADGLFSLSSDGLFSQEGSDGIAVIAEGTIWTYVLLALIIIAGLYEASQVPAAGRDLRTVVQEETIGQVQDPHWWHLLLGNIYFALLWLPLRFFVGREWLAAGEHKLRDDGWMSGGASLQGYWERAVTVPEGRPTAPAGTYEWFRKFLDYMLRHEWYTWFAKVIAIGEFLIGLGILVGALVGIAAFFGTLMNFNFQLAGSASTNPVLFGLGVFLVLAWKVAGYWGLDRWLLSLLGTPWQPGRIFEAEPLPPQPGPLRS